MMHFEKNGRERYGTFIDRTDSRARRASRRAPRSSLLGRGISTAHERAEEVSAIRSDPAPTDVTRVTWAEHRLGRARAADVGWLDELERSCVRKLVCRDEGLVAESLAFHVHSAAHRRCCHGAAGEDRQQERGGGRRSE